MPFFWPRTAGFSPMAASTCALCWAPDMAGCATDGSTCDPLWRGAVGPLAQASVAVADGMIYLGTHDSRLLAFTAGCRDDGGVCRPAWRTARMVRA